MTLLNACSNIPVLPNTTSLATQSISQQYFYCESCVKPSNLTEQQYQVLEPDAPLPVIIPIVLPDPIKQNTTSIKPQKHPSQKRILKRRVYKKPTKHKKVVTQQKQCILWSK